jgi:glutamate-1-semialdehyde 2,1-aminomutase
LAAAREAGIPVCLQQVGTMFTLFFTPERVTNWASAKACDTARYAEYFWAMLEGGVYLAPSQFEAGFLSTTHTGVEIEQTVEAARGAFRKLTVSA